jgi:hypothetical protein
MENIIESFEYFDYRPSTTENFNAASCEFNISAINEDIITQPSKSLLVIQGTMSATKDNTSLLEIDPDKIHFINNGILHLFDRIDYYVGDAKIDTIRKPGVATLIKGLVSFERDLQYNMAGWKINSTSHKNILNKQKYFQVTIPLSILMGFFEDFKNFLYRIPQKLTFYRSTSDKFDNLLYADPTSTAGYAFSLSLTSIFWRVPQVKFNLSFETQLRKDILNKQDYELKYRHWFYQNITPPSGTEFTWEFPVAYSKCKYVILAFQTNREGQISKNNSEFDFCDLENSQVLLNNSVYYPRERLNLNYSQLKCGNLYHMFNQFKISYYGRQNSLDDVEPLVDYDTFLTKYPIIAIDCSHQPDVIKESLINIRIMFNWRTTLPANTVIHCVVIMDKRTIYNPLSNRVISPTGV